MQPVDITFSHGHQKHDNGPALSPPSIGKSPSASAAGKAIMHNELKLFFASALMSCSIFPISMYAHMCKPLQLSCSCLAQHSG